MCKYFAVKRLRKTGLSAVLLIDQVRPLNSSKLSSSKYFISIYLQDFSSLFPKSHNSQFNSELEILSARTS